MDQQNKQFIDQPNQNEPGFQLFPLLIGRKKSLLIAVLSVLITGIIVGFFAFRTVLTKKNIDQNITPTRSAPTTQPTPTTRPPDPIINGKKQYSLPNFGMTFLYPAEWEIAKATENEPYEYVVSPVDTYGSIWRSEVAIQNPSNESDAMRIIRNRFDGPGSFGNVLYSEDIDIDGIKTKLVLRDYCRDDVANIDNPYGECGKKYGWLDVITFKRGDDRWEISGPSVSSKDLVNQKVALFKEILSSIKFIDNEGSWTTYRSEKFGVEFRHPNTEDWKNLDENGRGPAFYKDDLEHPTFYLMMNFFGGQISQNYSEEHLVVDNRPATLYIQLHHTDCENPKELNPADCLQKVNINNYTSASIFVDINLPEKDQSVPGSSSVIWGWSWNKGEKDIDEQVKIMKQILSSMKFF